MPDWFAGSLVLPFVLHFEPISALLPPYQDIERIEEGNTIVAPGGGYNLRDAQVTSARDGGLKK